MRRFIPHYPDMVLRVTGGVGFLTAWCCLAVAIAVVIDALAPL